MKRSVETGIETILAAAAGISVFSLVLITLFIFKEGMPLFQKVSPLEFLFGTEWAPTAETPKFGILPFAAGSLIVTAGALAIALPVGLGSGIFLAEMIPGFLAKPYRRMVELLAGIPSVIYGLFGYMAIAPLIRRAGVSSTGLGLFTAAIVLAIMILPTIISITDVSIRSVSRSLKEGALSLGATHWHAVSRTLIPGARSGILSGIILALGRALGETMAVLMVAGNAPVMPESIFDPGRTLTMNVATDMKYASGDHWTSLFSTGMVLFAFVLGLNILAHGLAAKAARGGGR